jgi:hypothetical protein
MGSKPQPRPLDRHIAEQSASLGTALLLPHRRLGRDMPEPERVVWHANRQRHDHRAAQVASGLTRLLVVRRHGHERAPPRSLSGS